MSQVYQSSKGYLGKVEKERELIGVAPRVLELLKKNPNKIYTSKEISHILKTTLSKVSSVLPMLLVTEKIKLVGIKKGILIYQSIKGNKKAYEIATESNPDFITLKKYMEINNIEGNIKNIKSSLKEDVGCSRLFYSNRGLVKEYLISYLQKVFQKAAKSNKRKIRERMVAW